ncbi:MAG TPA: FAD-dependent oxidoreductase [Microthrixaceae bacterium]|jgi:pyruvate/2-oxoglutarate dehydrogenase complex dihydrolipoamide dehydrogenase (E3) component|nr:FAD-dependent oxidoreductase [Microthrixaceae bacterium]
MPLRFVIIGGGPAGTQAATYAARLGAEVTLIERDIIGGAANLWDCVPSKAMIASGAALDRIHGSAGMGLSVEGASVDFDALRNRITGIVSRLESSNRDLLESQGVRLVHGTGRLVDAHTVVASTEDGELTFEADAILVSTGSRPRIPEWASPDGDRVLTTRDAYPPKELPEHLVVVGSGVTGVEFVHMFSSFGSEISLIVSRQQVLPQKDPEVAAVLEEDFLRRGVHLYKGARAVGLDLPEDGGVVVHCDDGRVVRGSHVLLAIGLVPNVEGTGLAEAGVEMDGPWVRTLDHHLRTNVPHIYVAGDLSGKLPLASVASMQGRKIAEHVMGLHKVDHRHLDYEKAASAIFTEPEIADVGLAEADAFAEGRKIRVTKVPFSSSAKALINDDHRGFVKIVSDPATGVVLGGSIVGRHAAELISVIAVAVTNRLRVTDIAESLLVHPALAEALAEAAE